MPTNHREIKFEKAIEHFRLRRPVCGLLLILEGSQLDTLPANSESRKEGKAMIRGNSLGDRKEQDAMPHDLNQQVFPFLADDPLYQREVREERIIQEVTDALQARISRQVDAILREILSERLEATVMEAASTAVRSAISDVNARLTDLTEFIQLLADLRFPSDDDADWWKHGGSEE